LNPLEIGRVFPTVLIIVHLGRSAQNRRLKGKLHLHAKNIPKTKNKTKNTLRFHLTLWQTRDYIYTYHFSSENHQMSYFNTALFFFNINHTQLTNYLHTIGYKALKDRGIYSVFIKNNIGVNKMKLPAASCGVSSEIAT